MFTRTQDLTQSFYDTGTLLGYQREVEGRVSSSCAYIMPSERVCDIDTEDDWTRAEKLFLSLKRKIKMFKLILRKMVLVIINALCNCRNFCKS